METETMEIDTLTMGRDTTDSHTKFVCVFLILVRMCRCMCILNMGSICIRI